jgi:glucose/arabinose dehydrogenase
VLRVLSSAITGLIVLAACSTQSQTPVGIENAFPGLTFTRPLFLTYAPDGTDRLFVAEQTGRILVFANETGVSSTGTFLDIGESLSSDGGEEGLLGLAFHPQYGSNGFFFVNYTAPSPRRTIVARFRVDAANPDRADPASEVSIIEIFQPYANHNGGMIFFGADGYLYIGMGDGGSAGDPANRAQNLDSLLGKILRIDVNSTTDSTTYGIPPDNPLIGTGHRPEIFAWGIRNPWRMSQDATGRIWMGDVGQNAWEEIALVAKGQNHGWRIMEGRHCYEPSSGCDTGGLTLPLVEYSHGSGNCSVTGGYVYRGQRRPDLAGAYLYGDWCTGHLRMLVYRNGTVVRDSLLLDTPLMISSFGEDRDGELYIVDHLGGAVWRFASEP